VSSKTPTMTHQEIFRRLHTIIEKIDDNTEVAPSYNFEDPKVIAVVTEWREELEDLKEKVKDLIK
jgi:2',3'-cyclic-nucleotide 2'-phosphodiesterase (5'-nucleotidase family)